MKQGKYINIFSYLLLVLMMSFSQLVMADRFEVDCDEDDDCDFIAGSVCSPAQLDQGYRNVCDTEDDDDDYDMRCYSESAAENKVRSSKRWSYAYQYNNPDAGFSLGDLNKIFVCFNRSRQAQSFKVDKTGEYSNEYYASPGLFQRIPNIYKVDKFKIKDDDWMRRYKNKCSGNEKVPVCEMRVKDDGEEIEIKHECMRENEVKEKVKKGNNEYKKGDLDDKFYSVANKFTVADPGNNSIYTGLTCLPVGVYSNDGVFVRPEPPVPAPPEPEPPVVDNCGSRCQACKRRAEASYQRALQRCESSRPSVEGRPGKD